MYPGTCVFGLVRDPAQPRGYDDAITSKSIGTVNHSGPRQSRRREGSGPLMWLSMKENSLSIGAGSSSI